MPFKLADRELIPGEIVPVLEEILAEKAEPDILVIDPGTGVKDDSVIPLDQFLNPKDEQDKLPPDELTAQDELRDDFSISADPEKIGRKLASLRKRAGLTQEDVAKSMKSNAKFVGRVERGATNPTLETLNGYARAIGRKIEFSFILD